MNASTEDARLSAVVRNWAARRQVVVSTSERKDVSLSLVSVYIEFEFESPRNTTPAVWVRAAALLQRQGELQVRANRAGRPLKTQHKAGSENIPFGSNSKAVTAAKPGGCTENSCCSWARAAQRALGERSTHGLS